MMMDDNFKQHVTAKETWLRGLFILLFAFLLAVTRLVTWAVVLLQFLFTLVTGRPNSNLLILGASLSHFIYQCFSYVTYNSDTRPFPFNDWPDPVMLGVNSSWPETTGEGTSASPKKKASAKKAARKKASTKQATKQEAPDETDVQAQNTAVDDSSDTPDADNPARPGE